MGWARSRFVRSSWKASSEISAAHNTYCPDDNMRSRHRPVLAMFQPSGDDAPSPRQLLLECIQRMEEELVPSRRWSSRCLSD